MARRRDFSSRRSQRERSRAAKRAAKSAARFENGSSRSNPAAGYALTPKPSAIAGATRPDKSATTAAQKVEDPSPRSPEPERPPHG